MVMRVYAPASILTYITLLFIEAAVFILTFQIIICSSLSVQLLPELYFTVKYLRRDCSQLKLRIRYILGFQLAR